MSSLVRLGYEEWQYACCGPGLELHERVSLPAIVPSKPRETEPGIGDLDGWVEVCMGIDDARYMRRQGIKVLGFIEGTVTRLRAVTGNGIHADVIELLDMESVTSRTGYVVVEIDTSPQDSSI